MSYTVAVMQANSVMGRDILDYLTREKREWISELRAFGDSSANTAHFNGQEIPIQSYSSDTFSGVDLAILGSSSHVEAGAVVISNGDAKPADAVTVIPDLNPDEIEEHRGFVAVPDAITIALAHTLSALGETTTQVSGTALLPAGILGPDAIEELFAQTTALFNQNPLPQEVIGGQLAFNTRLFRDEKLSSDALIRCPTSLISVMVPVFGGTTLALDFTTALTANQAAKLLMSYPKLDLVETAEPCNVVGTSHINYCAPWIDHGLKILISFDEVRLVTEALVGAAEQVCAREAF